MKRLNSRKEILVAQQTSEALIQRVERNIASALVSLVLVLAFVFSATSGRAVQMSAVVGTSALSIQIGGIVFLLVVNGLFVASSTALELLRPIHAKHIREGVGSQGSRIQILLDDKPRFVAACALAAQLVRLCVVWVAYPLVLSLQDTLEVDGSSPRGSAFLLASIIVAAPVIALNLFLGDQLPRGYSSLHPHRVVLALYRPIRFVGFLLWLPASGMVALANVITQRFGGTPSFNMPNQAEEEIKNLVESARETGEIEVDEKELLHSVFEFTDTVAREIMTPRVDMDAMPVRSEPRELLKVIQDTGHSRIPLFEETDDQIVGIIHAKDLLMAMVDTPDSQINLRKLMRPAQFVPENKDLHELLKEMRGNRNHLVVVQDEFGGTAGIVTVEDIVEQLVGSIVDEYDEEEPEVVSTGTGFIVEGKTHLDDVNGEVGSEFESEDFDTIGGFVFGLFGRQPDCGESIESDGHRFTIEETDGRRILKIRIEPIPEDEEQDRATG